MEILWLKHRIYPNPVENKLNFSHNHKKEVLDIQIYNTIGVLIYEDRISACLLCNEPGTILY